MNTPRGTFTAGQAAKQAGITRKALRVYRERGLVGEPERTAAGYCLYSPADITVLRFIRQARTLGLHLDDVAEILAIHQAGAAPCATVADRIGTRIAEIDAAIADLRALRSTLTRVRDTAPSACLPTAGSSRPVSVCAIVERAQGALRV
ncbi:MAG: MerR family transcriptional regulator [Pseudonocardia sp.]